MNFKIIAVAVLAGLAGAGCGSKENAKPLSLDEQAEASLRKMMALSEQSAGDDAIEREVAKAMKEFRAMDEAKKKTALAELEEAIKSAKTSADSSRLSMQGRNLFVSIIAANTDREAAGLLALWPWPQGADDIDAEERSLYRAANATDYFKLLFDLANKGKADGWKPYVDVDAQVAFDKETGKSKWIVAKGLADEMSDAVPVLVSANVDPASLITAVGTHDASSMEGSLKFSGDYAVIVRKGGSTAVIKRKYAKLGNVYNQDRVTIPEGFGYLVP